MNASRFMGLSLILVAVALWLMPYYGYERAMWHGVVAAGALIGGATLLFKGRRVSA